MTELGQLKTGFGELSQLVANYVADFHCRQPQNNEDLNNEDNIWIEDDLNTKDGLKNEDDLKTKMTSAMKNK